MASSNQQFHDATPDGALARIEKELAHLRKVIVGNGEPGLVGKINGAEYRITDLEKKVNTVTSLGNRIAVTAVGQVISLLLLGIGAAIVYFITNPPGGA